MHRLHAVAHVGEGAADDDAHRVVEIGLPHLGLDGNQAPAGHRTRGLAQNLTMVDTFGIHHLVARLRLVTRLHTHVLQRIYTPSAAPADQAADLIRKGLDISRFSRGWSGTPSDTSTKSGRTSRRDRGGNEREN